VVASDDSPLTCDVPGDFHHSGPDFTPREGRGPNGISQRIGSPGCRTWEYTYGEELRTWGTAQSAKSAFCGPIPLNPNQRLLIPQMPTVGSTLKGAGSGRHPTSTKIFGKFYFLAAMHVQVCSTGIARAVPLAG
jgi:hypothetical protein